MKKFILLTILISWGLVSLSQNATLDKALSYADTYVWYDGVSTDKLTTTDTSWTYTVWKKSQFGAKCYVDVLLDSTGGTANNVTIYLQNKKFPDTDFVTVSSYVWNGSNATSVGTVVTLTPTNQSITLSSVVDTVAFVFNSDSTITGTIERVNPTITITESNQINMGDYWRVLILGANNTLLADILRLNLKFTE